LLAPLEAVELEVELELEPELAAALEELLLEPPHPARSAAIAATATPDDNQAFLIWTFSSPR
jgi:hypothetical protein